MESNKKIRSHTQRKDKENKIKEKKKSQPSGLRMEKWTCSLRTVPRTLRATTVTLRVVFSATAPV